MAGAKDGGKLTAEYCKKTYGKDYYAKIGSMGGKAKVPKGFALNRELASKAGQVGGRISRRTKKDV